MCVEHFARGSLYLTLIRTDETPSSSILPCAVAGREPAVRKVHLSNLWGHI
jgi:hypothetical protein